MARPPCKRKLVLNAGDWRSLGVSPRELSLALTLFTGQTFLWKETRPQEFTGVIGSYLVSLKQTPDDDIVYLIHNEPRKKPLASSTPDVAGAARQVLQEYFTLSTPLKPLWSRFSAADQRFAAVAPYLQGARMLRQDPVECVFQFICSSNNHIQRITQMVNYLASRGTRLGRVHEHDFYTFPTLEQLSLLTENELRNAGFGYRAKYIVGAVQSLRSKDEGGELWLLSLRDMSLEDATTRLCTLPGIGPKVASCVALFSLDKHHAIPVDTHVWQIAVRYLTPELGASRLSVKLHKAVAQAFVDRFGEYAGWAHTVLFIAELASHQCLLPSHLRLNKIKPAAANKMKSAGTGSMHS